MSVKKLLKEVKKLLAAKEFDDAIAAATAVLELEEEEENYNALVFLGVAHTKKGSDKDLQAADTFYLRAIAADHDAVRIA